MNKELQETEKSIITEIVEFINASYSYVASNFDIISISTVTLAFLTGLLAYFTWVLAREARKTREQNNESNVIVSIEPHKDIIHFANIIIENVGKGVAYDVVIKEACNNELKDDRRNICFNDLSVFKQKTLKPNQKIECPLIEFSKLPQEQFHFIVSAKDKSGKLVQHENYIDTNCFNHWSEFGTKGLKDLVTSFEKFERSFNSITNSRKIQVETYNKNDREEEREERKKWYEEQKKNKSED